MPPNRKPCVIYILGRNRREYLLVDQKRVIMGLKDSLDADRNSGNSGGTSKGQKKVLGLQILGKNGFKKIHPREDNA